jgi:hypothetical protein
LLSFSLGGLPKSLSPAREAGHHCPNGDTQHAGRFRVTEFLDGHEQHNLLLLFRKLVKLTDNFSPQDGILLPGLFSDIRRWILFRSRQMPPQATLLTDEDVVHDCEEPSLHIAIVAAGMKLVQRSNQALMYQIIGVLPAPKQSMGVPSQSRNTRLDFGQHSAKSVTWLGAWTFVLIFLTYPKPAAGLHEKDTDAALKSDAGPDILFRALPCDG